MEILRILQKDSELVLTTVDHNRLEVFVQTLPENDPDNRWADIWLDRDELLLLRNRIDQFLES